MMKGSENGGYLSRLAISEDGGTRVETSVHRVSEEDRVEEIARILGGLSVTDTQREAARSLIRERTV